MGRVQDKVVLVTGAARGQGRSHAVRLAEEGADIILFDICHDIETNGYPLATPRDLEEAGLEVEKAGRRALTAEVDVRDRAAMSRELANAVAEFGRLDVVVANAGICPLGAELGVSAFVDAFDVDFIGVVNTVHAALPHLSAGHRSSRRGRSPHCSRPRCRPAQPVRRGQAARATAMPNSWWIPTHSNWPRSWRRNPSGPTRFIPPTATPRCSTAIRCTNSSGRTCRSRPATTPSWHSRDAGHADALHRAG